MTRADLAGMLEHTNLKPESTPEDIERLCDEAAEWGFHAVCVNPAFVSRACSRLDGTATVVVSVAGFPLGAGTSDVKATEARRVIEDGAAEVDIVLRVGELRAGDLRAVRDDIAEVADAVRLVRADALVKVILETAVLSCEQMIDACRCCAEAQADYVKTSTGFHPAGGATVEAVRLLYRHATPLKVKAAGGIRDWRAARVMIEAGAARIGTSSGVGIMKEFLAAAE